MSQHYQPPPGYKLVAVELAALTRVQWSGLVEAPEDMPDDKVVDLMYDHVDGTEFQDDVDFWDKGICEAGPPSSYGYDSSFRPGHRIVDDKVEDCTGTEEFCPGNPKGWHEIDWTTLHIADDGGEDYVDVKCKHCGRGGCLGSQQKLSDNILW